MNTKALKTQLQIFAMLIISIVMTLSTLPAVAYGASSQTANTVSINTVGELVQGKAPEHRYTPTDDGKKGRSKLVLKAPIQRASFDKQDANDPIAVKWIASNIPDNAVIEVQLETVKLAQGSVLGGGIWQGEVPEGDSTGQYLWKISGEGRADAGVYRVRTLIRACRSEGCDVNPRFPGKEEKIKVYAKSAWRTITITDGKISKEVKERKDKTKEAKKVYEGIKGKISCGNGNDYYDGGKGIDTLMYSGKRSDFDITSLKGGGFLFSDRVACRADTDVVVNIELFKFADVTLSASDLQSDL